MLCRQHIAQPFQSADIYLRTTVLEPENFAFYEAMAAGLPAVGFKRAGPTSLLLLATAALSA